MEKQEFECLTLCPLDGRYSGVKDALGEYFSEYALVKYRVFVEIQWLKFLIENVESDVLAKFDLQDMDKLTTISSELLELKKLKIQHAMMLKQWSILLMKKLML